MVAMVDDGEQRRPLRVTVWGENVHERRDDSVRAIYPDGMHTAIADGLEELLGDRVRVRSATLQEPEHGLPQGVLDDTDVLTWWGHAAHAEVENAAVDRIQAAVLGGMGLLVLHSGHESKIFRRLLGTSCSLRWRNEGERELVWTVDPAHPIAAGVPHPIVIEAQEMYGEHFDIPAPDELVFVSSFAGGGGVRGGGGLFSRAGGGFFFFPRAGRAGVRELVRRRGGVPRRVQLLPRRGADLLLQPRRPGVPRLLPSRRAARAGERDAVGRARAAGARRRPRQPAVAARLVRTMSPPPFATETRPGPLRGIVAGAGSLGPYWARELLESPDTELVGWVDLDADRVRTQAEALDLDGLPTGASVPRMLAEQAPDFLVNVTAPAAHHPVTLAALEAGVPVLTEKPLAATLAEAVEMVAAA